MRTITRRHQQCITARDRAAEQLPRPTLMAIARIYPGEAEQSANPRARSAVMRVAERTDEPWTEWNRGPSWCAG